MTRYVSAEVGCALGQQAQRIMRLADALEDAMDLLAGLEWVDSEDGRSCPWCWCPEDLGHAERCELGAALAHWHDTARGP